MVRASYESIFRRNDYAAVLVAAGRVRDVDELDRGGASLLGTAAYYGHAGVCRRVLDRGGAIDIRDRDGKTPLLTATWSLAGGAAQASFILEAARLLLERGASVDAADTDGVTALHYAIDCAEAAPELAVELLGRGADPGAATGSGQTPLMRAAQAKHLAAVRALIAHGADVLARDGGGRDALQYALTFQPEDRRNRSMYDVAACLIDAPAATGTDNDRHERMFIAAAYGGRVEVVEQYLADGMDLAVKVEGRSALDWVGWLDDEAMFDLLVRHGADLDSMLGTAIYHGRVDCATRCIDAGANADTANALRNATLHWREPVATLLKEHGADLDTMARHAAGCSGSPDALGWCLAEGANPDTASQDGATALHTAVSEHAVDKVRLLLNHGADPMARDHHGRVPADLVRTGKLGTLATMERDEILQLLTDTAKTGKSDTPTPA